MKNILPKLQILPVEDLLRLERPDEERSKSLVERLRASGVLRNPPMVAPLDDGSKRYMVLDGTNRTISLGLMGIPHCLCQIVDTEDKRLTLSTWNHVLWNWDANEFLAGLRGLDDIELREIDPSSKRAKKRWPEKTLVRVQFPDRKAYIVQGQPGNLIRRANKLGEISKIYSDKAELDRTTARQINEMEGMYEKLCAVVVYPSFKLSEVLELTSKGVLLPPGVTRFSVSPRALRVNYPMEQLSANKSLDEKNTDLEDWIAERTARKGIRFYSEATVMFDE